MEELEHAPDTSFERDVVCEDEDAFCLSLENIATLQKLLWQVLPRGCAVATTVHIVEQHSEATSVCFPSSVSTEKKERRSGD